MQKCLIYGGLSSLWKFTDPARLSAGAVLSEDIPDPRPVVRLLQPAVSGLQSADAGRATIESAEEKGRYLCLRARSPRGEDRPYRGATGPAIARAPVGEVAARKIMDEATPEPGLAIACPDCGSSRVKRRPRKPLERLVFSITNHRAYVCRECQRSFYARPGSA